MASLEAYERFIANEPEAEIEYRTIEVTSPDIGIKRYVFDFVPHDFTLEVDAPINAGQTVTFAAATGRVTEPAERDDGEQQLSIDLGGVDAELNTLINSVSGANYLTPINIRYRKYFSGDLSAPAVTPLYLQLTDINFENQNLVTIVAEDSNLASRRPGRYYLLEEFVGLK